MRRIVVFAALHRAAHGIVERADLIHQSGALRFFAEFVDLTRALQDIGALRDVSWVVRHGRVAKRDGAMVVPLEYSLDHGY